MLLKFKVLLRLLLFFHLAPYRIPVCNTNALPIGLHCHALTLFLFAYAKIAYVSVRTYLSKDRIRTRTLRILEPCSRQRCSLTCSLLFVVRCSLFTDLRGAVCGSQSRLFVARLITAVQLNYSMNCLLCSGCLQTDLFVVRWSCSSNVIAPPKSDSLLLLLLLCFVVIFCLLCVVNKLTIC